MNMQNLLQDGLLLLITTGRLTSIITGLVGLISVIIGGQALTRSSRGIASGRPKAITALVMGLVAMVFSVLHLLLSTGGFGTGSGKAGAIVALVLGLVGAVLGGLAFSRLQRVARSKNS